MPVEEKVKGRIRTPNKGEDKIGEEKKGERKVELTKKVFDEGRFRFRFRFRGRFERGVKAQTVSRGECKQNYANKNIPVPAGLPGSQQLLLHRGWEWVAVTGEWASCALSASGNALPEQRTCRVRLLPSHYPH